MKLKFIWCCALTIAINGNSSRLDNRAVIQSLDKQSRNIILNYDVSADQSLTLTNLSLDFDGDFLVAVDNNFTPVIIKKSDFKNYQIVAQNATVTPLYLSKPEAVLLGNVNLKKHTERHHLVGAPTGQAIYLLPREHQKADTAQKDEQKKQSRSKKRNRKNGH
jgi:hypothetical protein